MISFLQILDKESDPQPGGKFLESTQELFSTHPTTENRVKKLVEIDKEIEERKRLGWRKVFYKTKT
jgi:Zn-dependent protease with chaperone function